MSKLPINKDYVPMSGYKDVFYNPCNKIINNVGDRAKSKILNGHTQYKNPNQKSFIRQSIKRDSDIYNLHIETAKSLPVHRSCVITERKLNSKNSFIQSPITTDNSSKCEESIISIISPISPQKQETYENISQKIKDKIIEINSGDSIDKKIKLADNIIKLFKEVNIDENTLSLFLDIL